MKSIKDFYTVEIAKDPNTSPDILKKILEREKNDLVSCYAASNPNCPPETLNMVLERGNNDPVSFYASFNLNCPPEEKIEWMKKVGKIKRFDSTKHEE